MAKRREVQRREAILFRLTTEEAGVLEVVGFLHHVTANEFARREVVASLATWAVDPTVRTLLEERARFDAKPLGAVGRLASVKSPGTGNASGSSPLEVRDEGTGAGP